MKLFITLLATLFLFTACKEKPAEAASTNWKKSEHNYNIQHGNFGLELRNQMRSDYQHIEPSYNLGKKWYGITAAFRIAEEDGAREYRPKLDHQIINWSPEDVTNEDGTISKSNTQIWVGHRIEFRNYENESTNDYWRYRAMAQVDVGLTERFSVWGRIEPRWTFGQGQEDDTKIDDIRNQIGIKINLDDNISFSPYVEVIADKDMKRESTYLATALSIKF
jgi:hypothetical protein